MGLTAFTESRFFQVINGWTGLVAIVVSAILFITLMTIYIRGIRKEPRKALSFFTDDRRSTPTQILRVIVFLLLAAGFVAVVQYNIRKMATGEPVITTKVVSNTFIPSMLFCSYSSNDSIEVESATYFYGGQNNSDYSDYSDLTNSFDNALQDDGSPCKLLNETRFSLP